MQELIGLKQIFNILGTQSHKNTTHLCHQYLIVSQSDKIASALFIIKKKEKVTLT